MGRRTILFDVNVLTGLRTQAIHFYLSLRKAHTMFVQWQRPDAFTGSRKDCVGNSRSHSMEYWFPDTGWIVFRRNSMGLVVNHLTDPRQLIGVKVFLTKLPSPYRVTRREGVGQTPDEASL